MKPGVLALAVATALFVPRDSRACSCVGPHMTFLSPVSDAAPTSSHVRIDAPTGNLSLSKLVLRVHDGSAVAVQARTIPVGSYVTLVELVPTSALAANTRFEVATVEPNAHPPVTVIGTFKTGSAVDTTAPKLDSLGHQGTRLNARWGGGDCSIQGPWITLSHYVAHDERTNAQLAFGIWAPDRGGRIDTSKPPDTIVFPRQDTLAIGQTSLCDPHSFPLSGNSVTLAVAAIDESGNASRALRFHADLTHDAP